MSNIYHIAMTRDEQSNTANKVPCYVLSVAPPSRKPYLTLFSPSATTIGVFEWLTFNDHEFASLLLDAYTHDYFDNPDHDCVEIAKLANDVINAAAPTDGGQADQPNQLEIMRERFDSSREFLANVLYYDNNKVISSFLWSKISSLTIAEFVRLLGVANFHIELKDIKNQSLIHDQYGPKQGKLIDVQ